MHDLCGRVAREDEHLLERVRFDDATAAIATILAVCRAAIPAAFATTVAPTRTTLVPLQSGAEGAEQSPLLCRGQLLTHSCGDVCDQLLQSGIGVLVGLEVKGDLLVGRHRCRGR